jgi:hypothetical protein
MTDPSQSSSVQVVDEIASSVATALAAHERRESSQNAVLSASVRSERIAAEAVSRLEDSLAVWRGILSDVADRVRSAHDDLAALDANLRQSLDAFAAARKHLQSA